MANFFVLLKLSTAFIPSADIEFIEKYIFPFLDSVKSPYNISLNGLEIDAILYLLQWISSSPMQNEISASSSEEVEHSSPINSTSSLSDREEQLQGSFAH